MVDHVFNDKSLHLIIMAVINPRMMEAVMSKGGTVQDGTAQSQKMLSLTWAAASQGSVYVAHYPVPMILPTFCYQIKGARLVAMVNVMEMAEALIDNNVIQGELSTERAPELLQDSLLGGVWDLKICFKLENLRCSKV